MVAVPKQERRMNSYTSVCGDKKRPAKYYTPVRSDGKFVALVLG
jgi:hypothetical protein